MSDYPEHDKLDAVKEKSQAIGEFLDFGPYKLCTLVTKDEDGDELRRPFYTPVGSIQNVLAEWFGIDLDALEQEKRVMLDKLRAAPA